MALTGLTWPPLLQIMRQDVVHAASCGAQGVALGMVTADGKIALDQLRPFVTLCSALGQWCTLG